MPLYGMIGRLFLQPLHDGQICPYPGPLCSMCCLLNLATSQSNYCACVCFFVVHCCLNGILQLYNNMNCSQVRQEKGEFPVPWKSVNSTTRACITKMGWWLPKVDGYGKLRCIIWIMSCIRCTSFVSQSKLLYYVSFGYT